MTNATESSLIERVNSLLRKPYISGAEGIVRKRQCLEPIMFQPVLKHALWGGQKLGQVLGKADRSSTDVAECWEVSDLPGCRTLVSGGKHRGKTITQLLGTHRRPILGRHSDRLYFPLLVKFLDAQQELSVQVHPYKPALQADGTVRPGKAEAWVVLEAEENSRVAIGLKEGVSEPILQEAIQTGTIRDCLNFYSPKPGDCFFLPPGTVHALGGGLLVAEIQEPSDITYRLHDWGRRDKQGQLRQLDIQQGIESSRFDIGPVGPVVPRLIEGQSGSEILVESEYFVIHRHTGPLCWQLPNDETMHILVVLAGALKKFSPNDEQVFHRGASVVIPASRENDDWILDDGTVILDVFLPAACLLAR